MFFHSATEGKRTHCILQPTEQGESATAEAIKVTGLKWQGFGSRGTTGVPSVRSC